MKIAKSKLKKIIREEIKRLVIEKGGDIAYPGDLGIATGTGVTSTDTSTGEEQDLDSEIEGVTSQLNALRSQGTSSTVSSQKKELNRQLSMLTQKKSQLASE